MIFLLWGHSPGFTHSPAAQRDGRAQLSTYLLHVNIFFRSRSPSNLGGPERPSSADVGALTYRSPPLPVRCAGRAVPLVVLHRQVEAESALGAEEGRLPPLAVPLGLGLGPALRAPRVRVR